MPMKKKKENKMYYHFLGQFLYKDSIEKDHFYIFW